jgi:hypothetical protein
MSCWASDPTALGGRCFFRDKPDLAAQLRLVFSRFEPAAEGTAPVLAFLEPFLGDDYDLVWRVDRDLWRIRLFFFRGEDWLALEFRQTHLSTAWRSTAPQGPGDGGFTFRAGAFEALENAGRLRTDAEGFQARLRQAPVTSITRFRFQTDNGRVFDSLATCAKLRLLSESHPDFRFHVLEVHRRRALTDPAALPLGALFHGAAREGRRPAGAAVQPGDQPAPEHRILSTIYLFGGMKLGLRQGLDPLFEALRPLPQPAHGAFTLAVSLDLEKRVWVEQVEALAEVLGLLLAHHPRVELLVNGMTATVAQPPTDPFADIAARELEAMAVIAARLPGPVTLRHLHGQTLLEKCAALRQASYFIGPVGSASLLPLALGLPGLVYGNREAMRSVRWMFEPRDRLAMLPLELVQPVAAALGMRSYKWARGLQSGSYSIQPAAFLAHVAAELRRLSLLPPAPNPG